MKKCLSLIMAIVLICCVFPISVSATEPEVLSRNALIEEACNLFPEYESKIRGKNLSATYSQSRSSDNCKLVYEETRSVSNTQNITYSEFSDGTVYVTGSTINAWYQTNFTESDNSFTTIYTGNFTITSNVNENALIVIEKIKFAIATAYNSMDYMISPGSATTESSAKVNSAIITRETETTNLPAEITYRIQFTSADKTETEPFILYLRLKNNGYDVDYVYDTSE